MTARTESPRREPSVGLASAAPQAAGASVRPVLPGDGLLHPAVVVAIVVLLLNDQLLKRAAPGPITGKLSDVAGLVLAPVLLVAAGELAARATGRWQRPTIRAATVAVVATGLGFAAVKLLPPVEAAWELALGIVQWPASLVGAVAAGTALSGPRPVVSTPDATDLVALPAVWLAFAIARRRALSAAGSVSRASADAIARPGWWYELGVAALSAAMLAGAIVDGWAHTHDPRSLETVLTPWHAIIYVSFVLVTVLAFAPSLAARLEGRNPVRAIPDGFGLTIVGVVLFLVVGLLDLAWHLAFGLEAGTEALLSPTHLGLGATAALIAAGPVAAAWRRADAGWLDVLPAIVSVMAITGFAAFALHPVNLFVDAWPRWPYAATDATWYGPNLGIAGAIVPTLILFVPLLELARRWPVLPPGTATLVVGGSMAGLTFLHDGEILAGAPILGGLLVDILLLVAPPGRFGRWPLAIAGPALVFAAYFLVLSGTGPVAWSAHLIGGTVAIAAIVGASLGWLSRHPGGSLTGERSSA